MKPEYDREDEFLLREFDFSRAVRGEFAHRFTPEERDAFQRDSAFGMVQEITGYAVKQIQRLEASLFTLLILGRGGSGDTAGPEPASLHTPQAPGLSALAGTLCDSGLLDYELGCRLHALAHERAWMTHPRNDVYTGPGSFTPIRERLEAIYDEARALREKVDGLVARHLARSGMSEEEEKRLVSHGVNGVNGGKETVYPVDPV